MLEYFQAHNRTFVDSPTGSGKTTFILEWLADQIDNQIIFSVPYQSLAEQLAEKTGFPAILEGAKDSDFKRVKTAKVVIVVNDSLWRISNVLGPERFSKRWVIFDEAHHLVTDCATNYKYRQINQGF